jgi:hypothetical protein
MNRISCIAYRVSRIVYCVSCIAYHVLYIVYCVSCILYCVLCIVYCLSCIVYRVLCIVYHGMYAVEKSRAVTFFFRWTWQKTLRIAQIVMSLTMSVFAIFISLTWLALTLPHGDWIYWNLLTSMYIEVQVCTYKYVHPLLVQLFKQQKNSRYEHKPWSHQGTNTNTKDNPEDLCLKKDSFRRVGRH